MQDAPWSPRHADEVALGEDLELDSPPLSLPTTVTPSDIFDLKLSGPRTADVAFSPFPWSSKPFSSNVSDETAKSIAKNSHAERGTGRRRCRVEKTPDALRASAKSSKRPKQPVRTTPPRGCSADSSFVCSYPGCAGPKSGGPRRYRRQEHLQRHVQRHGGRKYWCSCGKDFTRPDNMEIHRRKFNHSPVDAGMNLTVAAPKEGDDWSLEGLVIDDEPFDAADGGYRSL